MSKTINLGKDLQEFAIKHKLQAALISVVRQKDVDAPLEFHFTEVYEGTGHMAVTYIHALKAICLMQQEKSFLPQGHDAIKPLKKLGKILTEEFSQFKIKENK